MATSITKQLNTSFDTNIKIGEAKIDLSGRLRLGEILIRDHKQDTLFYANKIKLKLDELEGVLKGDYLFTSLTLDRPLLMVKTYQDEKTTNLQVFIDKLKGSSKKEKPFLASIDGLFIENASVLLKDLNKGSTFLLEDLNVDLSSLIFNTNSLSGDINQLRYRSPHTEDVLDLTGKLSFKEDKLNFEKFSVKTSNGQIQGELKVDTPTLSIDQILEQGVISLQISQGKINSEFSHFKNKSLPKGTLSFSGEASGPLSKLNVNFLIQSNLNSRFEGDLLIGYKKDEKFAVKGKNIVASIKHNDLIAYSQTFFPSAKQINQFNFNQILIDGGFVFQAGKTFTSSLSLNINQSKFNTELTLTKQEKDWSLAQQIRFVNLGNKNLFKSLPLLARIDGNVKINGSIAGKKLSAVKWDAYLSKIQWDKVNYQNIKLEGEKNPAKFNLAFQINDPKVLMSGEISQALETANNNFLIKSKIEDINLSAFGLASPKDQVRLATNLTIVASRDKLKKITVSNTVVENKLLKNTFDDMTLLFTDKAGEHKVIQQGSDLFKFSLDGRFSYQNIPLLIEGAVREAILLPHENRIKKEEHFTFNLSLNKKTLKAFYPAVETPNDISLKGEISSLKGASNISFNLPYVVFNGYTVENLNLKTSTNKNKAITHFKASRLKGNNINIAQLELITKEINDDIKGTINGYFGLNNINQFSVNFTYDQTIKKAAFGLDRVNIDLDGDIWELSEAKNNTFIYDIKQKEFIVDDLALSTSLQSFEINGAYKSKNNFSFELVTDQLSLAKILPRGDKFNFEGKLSSVFSIVQGEQQQILQADIQTDALVINGTEMGDFSFKAGGSSKLKTYQIETSLTKSEKNNLSGFGNIFISNSTPKIDLDLQIKDLDMSFLSALGKDKITEIKGYLSGDLNLWGGIKDIKLKGQANVDGMKMSIPSINTRYKLKDNTILQFRDRTININKATLYEESSNTLASLNGQLSHFNLNAWEMDLQLLTNRLLVYDRPEDKNALFYGKGYLTGEARFTGPTKSLTLEVLGSTAEGTTLVIPWQENKGLSDTSFIDYVSKGNGEEEKVTADISIVDEAFRGFEMIFDLDVNRNAEVEIVVDQTSGSTLSGRGSGNILIETNIDGKFNIWGDFIAYDGIYNFKNLGLIDKKFVVEQGGTIVWEGDPLEAQLNIKATYQVPGGANPALLVDNPNFNRKIPTNVGIQLVGNLIKPDDPVFDISFPNTTGIVVSEINYRLADQQRRQLQAISLLSQGIFISDVSVSFQGITNNLYEKASDVFSTLLGSNEGKLNVGLNYLQGEENPTFDLRTEDRIGLTLSTQLSDRILINGKIGVPIDGVEQSVIVGDVQIDFILNESGSLKAKVFNRENDFRYLGDEFGYTQGMGMSYQVDFNTFQELLKKIKAKGLKSEKYSLNPSGIESIDFENKKN